MKPRVFLYGQYIKRTPASYSAYKRLLGHHFNFVDQLPLAQIVMIAHWKDAEMLNAELKQCTPKPLVFIVSEEPFWDTLFNARYTVKIITKAASGFDFPVVNINHETSSLFAFDKLPYFITTEDHYFARYNRFFTRNTSLSEQDWAKHWQAVTLRYGFVFEKRTADKFDFSHANQVIGLCRFRSLLAQQFYGDENTLVEGMGWQHALERQRLPDWHLDKLQKLNLNALLVSALENTHSKNYVTEKVFDACAVGSVPVIYCAPDHRLWRLIPEDSVVNLFGLTVEQAAAKLQNFKATPQFIESYVKAQGALYQTFSQLDALQHERLRFVECLVSEIMDHFESHNS